MAAVYTARSRPGNALGTVQPRSWHSTTARRKDHLHDQSLESFNFQIRKIIKRIGGTPGPTEAAIKLIGLDIDEIEDKRARQRAAEAGKPRPRRYAPGATAKCA